MATTGERCIGIDVAKAWLDVGEQPGGATWRVPNDPDGGRAGVDHRAAAPPPIVLAASGQDELGGVTALALAGFTPVVANPLSTRRCAQRRGRRATTDRIDARMLAQDGARRRPPPRPLPDATARELQERLARHRQLTTMLVAEKNRHQQAAALVRPSIAAHIAWLAGQRDAVDALLASVVARDPAWQARVALLETVPGIGALTATILAGGLPELGEATGKELAALVGVAPFAVESGQQRGQRHISGGRHHLRHAVSEAVKSTVRWEPTFAAHVAHLLARGKPRKVAVVACMRRLLGILTVMVRDDLTWRETKVGSGAFLAQPT